MTPDEPTSLDLGNCTYLGGSHYNLTEGEKASVSFQEDAVVISRQAQSTSHRVGQAVAAAVSRRSSPSTGPMQRPIRIPFAAILNLAITGPGQVTTGGGLIGGGFGVTGALEGMAVAGIVNALTTRSTIHTFVQIITHRGELFFHYDQMEPAALRIYLSPVFTRLRQFDPAASLGQLERLAALREKGMVSEDEAGRLKGMILGQPAETPDKEQEIEQQTDLTGLPVIRGRIVIPPWEKDRNNP